MMKPTYLSLDTKDDRRELITLLGKLPPAHRVAWLADCCQRSAKPRLGLMPQVSRATQELAAKARWDDGASERLTIECYTDALHLSSQYDFDLLAAAKRLEAFVRRRR